MEVNAITTVSPRITKVAFIGSGPLPLTSLCLLHQLKKAWFSKAEIMNIDHDIDAIIKSQTLCQGLGRQARDMKFFHTKCPGDFDLAEYDVVYLAALVGLMQTVKEDLVLSTLGSMRSGAILVIRSVWGMRGLLYPVSNTCL
jgi:nicotianamine synthase